MTNKELQGLCDGDVKGMDYIVRPDSIELAKGKYRGLKFSVVNNGGNHPCGYVDASGTPCSGLHYDYPSLLAIDVHGGITYSDKKHPLTGEGGWWIGWDYAHLGDCIGGMSQFGFDGTKYATFDIIRDCISVID